MEIFEGMNTDAVLALAIGLMVFIFINLVFNVRIFEGLRKVILEALEAILDAVNKYNTRKYVERRKKEAIDVSKENAISKYNTVVENIIIDFQLPLTLESFTSTLCVSFVLLVLLVLIFMQNVTLSFVMAVSIFIGLSTLFVMRSQRLKTEKMEQIMDAEDIICPLAHEGVFVAIKKVMQSGEYIHENIRPYFAQFINNCENNGYSFRQAMELLNRQLGRKFDNFASKAIIFEYNERKGMADIFMDVVDENAILREINIRKDKVFRKMNRDFLLKTLIIVLFFLYALTIPEFRDAMMNTTIGRVVNTILVSMICLSFAKCQSLQGNLGIGGIEK